jgi:hypothetical protein
VLVVATGLLVLVAAVLFWTRVSDPETSARLGSTGDGVAESGATREAAAAAIVDRLERAVRAEDTAASVKLSGGEVRAASELRQLVSTATELDLEVFELRYVSTGTALTDGELRRFGPDAFVADVDLSWQLNGLDDEPSSVEVPVVLRDDGVDVTFVTARRPSARAPIWFNDHVTVQRPDDGLLLVRSRGVTGGQLAELATTGVRTVRSALPSWDGQAVIEAPGTVGRFADVSGLSRESARGIAAVTTSSDGSVVRGSPQRVFLNPGVFNPLGASGQQIVLSHELTHVAVDGASSAMPLWLSEGYADYVALRRTEIPVQTLAAQILRLVRADGAPAALPREEQFEGTDPDVGAWYESSWLAARLLAEKYGEPALHAFYRQADRDGGTDRAFDRLGTTEREFTQSWRTELERLAA